MNFFVFIRSIGERTERLCYESVARAISPNNIVIIKDFKPSYLAYAEMFKKAKEFECDWYLGLDADVVLREGWFDFFLKGLKEKKNCLEKIFRMHFFVADNITGSFLLRGNHFYNGKYTDSCQKFIGDNTRYSIDKRYLKSDSYIRYILKPESTLEDHFGQKMGVVQCSFNDVIGWHGFEQFYKEIFRQYVVRRHRDSAFINKFSGIFDRDDSEAKVARLGWDSHCLFDVQNINKGDYSGINKILEENKIIERASTKITLSDFYFKYSHKIRRHRKFSAELKCIIKQLVKGVCRPFKKNHKKDLYNSYFNLLHEGEIVIDCGANVGEISEIFISRGAQVYAFEPNPHAFRILRERFAGRSSFKCFEKAVYIKNGKMPLYFHENSSHDEVYWSQGSSLLKDKNNININKYVEVKTINLSEFIIGLKRQIRILKLDVEGAEFDIVPDLINQGAISLIDYLLVEYHDKKNTQLRSKADELRNYIGCLGLNKKIIEWF